MIQIRHYRPVYGTSGIYDTSGYGASATRDRGASMALEVVSPSMNQMRFLEQLAKDAGEATPVLVTAQEARSEINRLRRPARAPRPEGVRRPTSRQLSYLASLARETREEPIVPDSSHQASVHIPHRSRHGTHCVEAPAPRQPPSCR